MRKVSGGGGLERHMSFEERDRFCGGGENVFCEVSVSIRVCFSFRVSRRMYMFGYAK